MREFDLNGLRIAEFQAKIFERSLEYFSCSSPIFIRRFLHSNLLERLDKNNSVFFSLDPNEALEDIKEQFGESSYGKERYTKDELFWLGYLYRYISYTREVNTRLLFKLFDYRKVRELYYVYHTQDMEWVIANLLELFDLTEDIFNPNYRLKMIMIKNLSV